MYEVIYYQDGYQATAEFHKEKEAIKFAMKVKGIVFLDSEIIDNFSD